MAGGNANPAIHACSGIRRGYSRHKGRSVIAILGRKFRTVRMGLRVHSPHYKSRSGHSSTRHTALDHYGRSGTHQRSARTGSGWQTAGTCARRVVSIFVLVSAQNADRNNARHLSDGRHRRRRIRYRNCAIRIKGAVYRAIGSAQLYQLFAIQIIVRIAIGEPGQQIAGALLVAVAKRRNRQQ